MYIALSVNIAEAAKNCSTNWAELNGECIYFGRTPTSWTSALEQCKGKGGYLLTDDNEEKHSFLTNIASLLYGFGEENYWIGGTDEIIEGSWRWVETGMPMTNFDKWSRGYPTTNASNNCLYMAWENGELRWRDSPCQKPSTHHGKRASGIKIGKTSPGNYFYICEKP
ncbi:hypothetical protein FSP39_013428 [Pinctada imbricata]|uniref:C-type lectin domain-containing protein n=1 Tax=Pinctada imbricata TaxID=66713 RepID=A0AA88XL52_PINIB|nr:hypothetical protein FSP39_013428 [Pinctada imbricata]